LFLVGFIAILALLDTVDAGKDFYKALGVPRDASLKQIKKAYRELSLKYHPDKNPGDEAAAQKFVEIGNAYEVLSDDDKRRKYDQFGEEGLKGNQGGGGFGNPFDIFSNFGFGGGGRQEPQERRSPSVEMPFEVTLRDLYVGKEITIGQKKQILCPKCRGTGGKDPNDVQQCPDCRGSGTKVYTQQLGPGFMTQTQRTCDRCGGKGKLVKATCPHCKGSKVAMESDTITVDVERGMPDGHKIVFSQEADEIPEHVPGDVTFRIVTLPHKRFTRNVHDLHTKMTISLLEALVGFSKTFRHLDDHTVTITRDVVTKPGEVIKVEGEGMPHHNYASQTGDLFVEIAIRMPASVTEEQKEGFKQLLATA
jgi:DnaJ-related protein SCJ1